MAGKAVYKWEYGNMPVAAQVAGEYLTALEKSRGILTATLLVDESRDAKAVLHDCFEWDDAKAAEAHRETQAGYILRNIKVTYIDDGKPEALPTRAFVNVQPAGDTRGYVPFVAAMNDAQLKEQVLRTAYNDLCNFRRKYEQYSAYAELNGVFSAIDSFADSLKEI